MKFNVLLVLHLIALHSSIAAMEVMSWLIFLLASVAAVIKREKPLKTGADLWLLGFALSAAVGLFLSAANMQQKLFELGFLRWILLLYALAYALKNSGLLNSRKFMWLWLGLAATAGAYAFFQFVTGIDFVRPHKALSPAGAHGFRATGFFSLALTLAYVLGISGSVLLPQIRNVAQKKLFLFLWCFILIGLFASLSRASWGAIVLVIFIFAIQEIGRKALWGLVPMGAVFALLFAFEPEFQRRILDIFETSTSSSSGQRLDIWRGYWQIAMENPLFGVGLFQGDELLPGIYAKLGIQQPFVSHAHNNYLQALAGTGIFGLIGFVAFNFLFLKMSYSLYRSTKDGMLKCWAQGVFLAQVFWQLGGLTECNFFDGEVNHMIVFTWALLVAISATDRGRSSQDPVLPRG